jgi:hypothetical protein
MQTAKIASGQGDDDVEQTEVSDIISYYNINKPLAYKCTLGYTGVHVLLSKR